MYIRGWAAKLVKAGKCVLGINKLLNQLFTKVVEGNNFGFVKNLVSITQELMKEMHFSWYHPFLKPLTLVTHISFKTNLNDLSACNWKNGSDYLELELTILTK